MKRLLPILFLLLASVPDARSQSVDSLNVQIENLRREMQATEALLGQSQTDRQSVLGSLGLVQRKLTLQTSLVTSLDSRIAAIGREVRSKTRSVEQLGQELDALKAEYAALIRAAYRSRQNNTMLAFLFASRDFQDVTRRIYYLKRYGLVRRRKAAAIDSVSLVLQRDVAELNGLKDSLAGSVRVQRAEAQKLSKDREEFRRMERSLGSQITGYRNRIAQQQRQVEALQDRIRQIIAEEARRSQAAPRSAAEEEALVRLTGRFDENRGRLPSPVAAGVVVRRFGPHPHPTQRGVTVNNNGINLAVERGATVRAVFDGEVIDILKGSGINNTVILRHGNYYTTYSNLETISVKAGDKVATGQSIGRIYSGTNAENYILPFTVSDGTKSVSPRFVDPELWLRR
jgi:septal ring factor EnvC (AmiA/AmiB activator)